MRDPSPFRQESLERLSSPERLDRLMQVVRPKDWLVLSTLGSLIAIALLWSVFGRIPVTASGRGILVYPRRIATVESPVAGQLNAIKVNPGDCVEPGAVLATLEPTELIQQQQLAQTKLEQLRQQNREATTLSSDRLQDELAAITRERASLDERIATLQAIAPQLYQERQNAIAARQTSLQQQLEDANQLVPVLQDRLQRRKDLLAEGAISEDRILEVELQYRENLQRVSELEAQLQQLEVEQTELQQQHRDRLDSISQLQAQRQELDARQTRVQQEISQTNVSRQNNIRDLEREIAQLQTQIQQRSTIKSPHPGCLLELTVKSGQWVQSGTSLGTLRLTQPGSQLVAVTYFAIADGKRIQPEMTVRVTPATVKRERFGGMIGSVTSISEFPVTPEGATSVVGTSQLAQDLLASEPKIEVFAQLQRNPANFSGYTWSSSQGPPSLKISPGTTTEVRVTVERRAPITFILPILRRWFG